MKLDKMVLIMEYDSVTSAEMAKSILDSAGIWTMINNEYMSTIYPTGIMPAQLIVMEADVERAKRLLEKSMVELEEPELG
ncbi:MAG: DUF2007 domain-containing protein [Rikenellaceae bacterium]